MLKYLARDTSLIRIWRIDFLYIASEKDFTITNFILNTFNFSKQELIEASKSWRVSRKIRKLIYSKI